SLGSRARCRPGVAQCHARVSIKPTRNDNAGNSANGGVMRFARTVLSATIATVALAAGCQTVGADLPTRWSQRPPQPAGADPGVPPAAAPLSLVQCSAEAAEVAEPHAPPGTECAAQVIPLLSLDEALRTAETRQPQLVVAAAAIDAARGRYRQAQVYPNPTA